MNKRQYKGFIEPLRELNKQEQRIETMQSIGLAIVMLVVLLMFASLFIILPLFVW